VRAGVEDNRHSKVEHPDAWAHHNLDELDRAYATAGVRCPPVQAMPPTKQGHPHWGAPWCGVWLPVRDVDLRLDVNDPRVVAKVGRDVDQPGIRSGTRCPNVRQPRPDTHRNLSSPMQKLDPIDSIRLRAMRDLCTRARTNRTA